MIPTDNSPKLEALLKLYEERVAGEREKLHTEHAAFEASFAKSKEGSLLHRLSGKHIVMAGGAFAVLVIAIVSYVSVQNSLRPGKLLAAYEEQLREEQYDEAHATVSEYFDIKEDNWNLTASHANLLLRLGRYEDARVLYARLLARSPLSSEPDILYLSGLSYLPDLTATRIKMTEVLASSPHAPTLLARALLDDQALERRGLQDIEAALDELSRVPSEGESYKNLQDLTKIFIINICRNKRFRESVYPDVATYPAGLRSSDLYLFGLDPRVSLNFCSVVPTGRKAFQNIEFDLESLALGLKAFMHARLGDYEGATKVLATGRRATQNPVNAYIDGVVSFQAGEFARAEESLVATELHPAADPAALPLTGAAAAGAGEMGVRLRPDEARAERRRELAADPQQPRGGRDDRKALRPGEEGPGEGPGPAEPVYAFANYNYAVILLEVDHDPGTALPIFQSIANQNRAFPGVRYYFALANIAADDPDAAILMLKNNEDAPHFGVLSKVALANFYAREYTRARARRSSCTPRPSRRTRATTRRA